MASDTEMSETSFLERLFSPQNRDFSVFIPFILGLTNSPDPRDEEDDDGDPDEGLVDRPSPRDRIVVINPFTQGMVVIEGSSGVDSLLREMQSKDGQPPASRAAIEALPRVEITPESCDGECAVCLEDWEIGGFAKEMPCKHRFHGDCIEKWLGIHGSCPVCRHKMPIQEEEDVGKERDGNSRSGSDGDGGEGRRGRGVRREIWVSFGFNGRR